MNVEDRAWTCRGGEYSTEPGYGVRYSLTQFRFEGKLLVILVSHLELLNVGSKWRSPPGLGARPIACCFHRAGRAGDL